jgi:hypothetical protein
MLQGQNSNVSRLSHLEDHFQLDWSTERKACDSIHQAAGIFVLTEDVLEQLRSAISHSRLLPDISRSGHRYAESNNPRHFVERSEMLPRHSEGLERSQPRCLAARLGIELGANAPNEFRCVPFRGEHSAQEKQVARLYSLHVDAKRLWRYWKLDAKFLQPLLGAGRPRAFSGYHLPACAPPSTCKVSPVVNVASVKNKTESTTSLISPILPRGCNPLRNS